MFWKKIKSQEIAQVSDAEKVPLEIALLFDVSASTDAMFQFEQETAAQFLQEVMRPADRATIFTVGEKPVLVQARGTAQISAAAIKNIQPTKQFTAFYDTVLAAANYLAEKCAAGQTKSYPGDFRRRRHQQRKNQESDSRRFSPVWARK